jgi:NADPH:quinone reductase-like Zn-dependent oxidoreductase
MKQPPDGSTTMRAALLETFSGPAGIRVVELPVPVPRRGEILVRVICSPVNPSDVLYCSGTYASPPTLPVVPGFEGCGIVVASGGGWLADRLVGTRVAGAVQAGQGFWAEYIVLKAMEAMPIPAAVSDESAASAFVNPLTALGLARPVIRGRHRAMIHTAGASQLGRMLIRLSRRHGFPLINIVHREALVAELEAAGGTHVLDASRADFAESLTALARKLQATWAADAVAGEMTRTLAACMPPGSTIAVYGVLSGKESTVNPGDLIFRGQTVTGYWLSREFQDRSPLGLLRISRFLRSARRLLASDLQTRPRAHVPLAAIATSLPGLLTSTSQGKIYIRPGDREPRPTERPA